jgi:kynureninase
MEHEVVATKIMRVSTCSMLSFYRPTADRRHLIVIEDWAFPSDSYAVASQASLRGFGPDSIVRLRPREGRPRCGPATSSRRSSRWARRSPW